MNRLTRLAVGLGTSVMLLTAAARAADTPFTIWSIDDVGSAEQTTWAHVVDEFKASHPGVTVKYEAKSFSQLEQSGTMILNSDEAPDITEYNKGNATSGVAASQGLLTPLDEVVKSRGWDKILSDGDFVLSRYDNKGVFGSGPIYGISPYGEFVSVFYNEDMFAANGVMVPATFDDFVAAMAAFRQKGITPLALGASDPEPFLGVMVDTKIDQKWFENYQGLKAPLDSAPFLYAAKALTDWMSKGYVPKDASGLKDDDAKTLFTSGKSPMYISGTWNLGSFASTIKGFKWSQFLLPTPRYTTASTGNLWVVPARSKHKELAYDFISLMLSPKFQTELSNNGAVAIAGDPSKITNPIGQRQASLFGQITSKGGLGFYLGWPVPGFRDVLIQKFTGLMAGSLTPEQFAADIKATYDETQANQ
jgi:raffinose/stachyose/melibiose transport system substrate-binding protein